MYQKSKQCAGFFDKILVDAPCSGEGMFRRDIESAKSWAANKPDACAALQREILHHAAAMLAPGGRIVYSTCTFSETEDEEAIGEFLRTHGEFAPLPVDYRGMGISHTRDAYAVRVWPHKADGEGHFAALMERAAGTGHSETGKTMRPQSQSNPPEPFTDFCAEHLSPQAAAFLLSGSFTVNGVSLYRVPDGLPDLRGLRIARSGWYMGDISKGRFTPSQAFAMGLTLGGAKAAAGLSEGEAFRYLKGESITPEESLKLPEGKPWVLVGCMGYPLGWAKFVNGRLKNHLPVGWII